MSIAGRGIVVTRPRGLAEPLAALIEGRGARAMVFPAIDIQPLPAPAALAEAGEFDLVIFVSPSAVRCAVPALKGPIRRAAAIGSGTRRELVRAGINQVLVSGEGVDSEALLAAPELQEVAGRRVLIVRGEGGRAFLGDSLRSRGASVEYAECYRRGGPPQDPAPLLAAWRAGRIDALTVTSAEALDNLMALQPGWLERVPLFVPHVRVAQHAGRRGVREVALAGPSDDEMIERLVAYFDERHPH
jgi:uroporphyrinogen-III synthase